MHRIYILLFGSVGSMSLLLAAFSNSGQSEAQPQAASSAAAREAVPDDWHDTRTLTLKRDRSGQFHLDVLVNGESVRFLVDTGADMVALTPEDAELLGLPVGEMQPILQTAAGPGYAAPVTLDELEVAGTVFRDVNAVVAQDLGVNLLGQSVLGKLGGVELKGDKMVLHPR